MSAKGRSSVVLLGCVASALLLAPLVYLAAAAWKDNQALNARSGDWGQPSGDWGQPCI